MNYNKNKNEEFDNTNNHSSSNGSSNSSTNYLRWDGGEFRCCLCIFSIILAFYTCSKSCNSEGIITGCSVFEWIFHLLAACCCYPVYIGVFILRVFFIKDIKFSCTQS